MALANDFESGVAIADVVSRTSSARGLTNAKVAQIRAVTHRLRILALNAMIEAARVGDLGRGFSVVAQEVRGISGEVEGISGSLEQELAGEIAALETMISAMARTAQGQRLMDLALNAIELIDRNLYERTCDVRWWATDSAFTACAADPSEAGRAHASERLGVILNSYTVYLDLWLCDLDGNVIASGRPDRYRVAGSNVSDRGWFARGRRLASGDDFDAEDIAREPLLGGAQVATYVASVRENAQTKGRPLGVLAIHFDWEPQAMAIVRGVRLDERERDRTRVLLVDAKNRVIAASDGRGILDERFPLPAGKAPCGVYVNDYGVTVAYHRTPGYETYAGLGWHGVIVQEP